MFASPSGLDEQEDKDIGPLLDSIRIQEESFHVGPEAEAVIILGNTLSGKSTLSLLVTEADLDVFEEADLDSLFYYNSNNGRIHNDWSSSFTPPIIDSFNGTIYYDWCGMNYDENLVYEVLPWRFLKKFAKSGKFAKFVFAIPEYLFDISAHTRIDRSPEWLSGGIVRFAEQASDIFENITKYKDAIGFVVTQSPNTLNEDDSLRTDEQTISNVVDYLEDLRVGLRGELERNDQQGYNLAKLIKFIDVLLEKNEENAHKIGVFKAPLEAGPVRSMEIQQNEKIAIRSMIANQLKFIKTNASDFAYAVSYKSKNTELYKKLLQHLE